MLLARIAPQSRCSCTMNVFPALRARRRCVGWLASAAFAINLVAPIVARAANSFNWEYSTPEEQGVDSEQLARLFAQIQRDRVTIHSFILVRHDRVISEAYVYPYTETTKHALYSVSKSFTSALLGIAIEQGLFTGVDERVVDIFKGVTANTLSDNMNRMTLRHLLTMSTGHATDTTQRITATTDWVKAFMELPVEGEPGSAFVYNSGASFMLSAAIQRKSGMNALEFARHYLFPQIGIVDATWDVGPDNISAGGWGLSLRPLDLARFGRLYLHQGNWDGEQIVPRWWVEESSRKQISNGTNGFWGSGYGYQFWLNDFGGFRADGAFAQYIFVLPEYDAVAVFTSNLSDSELPARLIRQYVLPAMRPGEPLAANPRGGALLARAAGTLSAAPGAATSPPIFTVLPVDVIAAAGGAATLSVAASGTPAPSYQWYKDELPVSGATAATLTLPVVSANDEGGYVAVIRNSAGVLASYPVFLTVTGPPSILEQPVAVAAAVGAEAEFHVRANGGDLSFAWSRDGVALPGEHASTLKLSRISAADAGRYTVVVSSPRGSVLSSPARLTVAAEDDGARLVNLSVRALAGLGDQTLIIGLVIGGLDPETGLPVLLRGVGPSLARLEVQRALADPAAVLYRGSLPGWTNGDWGGDAELASSAVRLGAFALPTLSADSVLSPTLVPRPYTMHVTSSLPDRTGIALAECYDATGRASVGGPRLVNLSARAFVGAAEETLIGGFVINGTGTLRVLIRGVGPTLATQQVSGSLPDPRLTLFSGADIVAENDDWLGNEAVRAAAVATGAFLLPADSKDAALLVTLPAGVYTAHVTGNNGGTGVALIEIYAVP